MKALLLFLFFTASALPVSLEWNAPAQNADIVGYRLKWGTISQMPIQEQDVGLALTATVPDSTFQIGVTYFFVAVSYNAAGVESVFSNEVQWTKPMPTPTPTPTPKPSPPESLRFKLTVINGKGDGRYYAGTIVKVEANKYPKRIFVRWSGDWVILGNRYFAKTTAMVPFMDTLVQAQYQ